MTILLVLILILIFYFLSLIKKNLKDNLIFFLIITGIFLWTLYPIIVTLVFWDNENIYRIVSYEEFIIASCIEATFLLLVLLFYYFNSKKKMRISIKNKYLRLLKIDSINLNDRLLKISIIIINTINLLLIFNFELGYTKNISQQSNVITLFLPFKEFALAFLVAYIIFSTKYKKSLLYISTLSILFDVYISLTIGSRISLIIILVLLILITLKKSKKLSFVKKTAFSLLLIAVIGVILILVPNISNLRAVKNSLNSGELIEGQSLKNLNLNKFNLEMLTKLNSVQNTALLIKHDGIDRYGINYIIQPFKLIIPRLLWTNKYSSDELSAAKLGAIYIGMNPETGLVGISPALGSLWSFGIWGLSISLIANFFASKILILLFSNKNGLIAKSFGLMLLNFPVFDRIPLRYDQFIQSLIVMIIIYFIFNIFIKETLVKIYTGNI